MGEKRPEQEKGPSRPATATYKNVRDLLGSFGSEAPWRIIESLADELDHFGVVRIEDFVAALGDIAHELRKGAGRG